MADFDRAAAWLTCGDTARADELLSKLGVRYRLADNFWSRQNDSSGEVPSVLKFATVIFLGIVSVYI